MDAGRGAEAFTRKVTGCGGSEGKYTRLIAFLTESTKAEFLTVFVFATPATIRRA